MADVNLRDSAVSGRVIRVTDVAIGFDPAEADASESARTDTWAEAFVTLLKNFPTTLTASERAKIRAALGGFGLDLIGTVDPASNSNWQDTGVAVPAVISATELWAINYRDDLLIFFPQKLNNTSGATSTVVVVGSAGPGNRSQGQRFIEIQEYLGGTLGGLDLEFYVGRTAASGGNIAIQTANTAHFPGEFNIYRVAA